MGLLAVARNKKDRAGPSMGSSRAVARQRVFAVLDVGSSKVACFIGIKEVSKTGSPMPVRVIGIGHQVCHGLKGGAVVDMDHVEHSIRAAVDTAERMADVHVQDVIVNVSIQGLRSEACYGLMNIDGREVVDADVTRVLSDSVAAANETGLEVIHAIPVGYKVDGSSNISHPAGMFGDELRVDVNLVATAPGPLRNLRACVERCHLGVTRFVASPLASGLACLVEDEMDLGVTLIDMGGGTTTVSVFADGALQFTGVVPVGGQAVTNDLARVLQTPVEHAERMKVFYGSAFDGPNDGKEMIRVPQVGEEDDEEGHTVPRAMLTQIIRPRLEETFELVQRMIEANPKARIASRGAVLTGGASQLSGSKELAGRILDKQMRLGRPTKLTGLADVTRGPAFSTAAGLLSFSANPPADVAYRPAKASILPFESRLGKLRSLFIF